MNNLPTNDTGRAGPDEKRVSRRGRTLLTGRIVYGDALYAADCTIRDITETGARVKVFDPMAFPNKVLLLEVRNFDAFEAEVKWRRGPEMGLSFTRKFSLDDISTFRNQQLRRIALEAKQRLGG